MAPRNTIFTTTPGAGAHSSARAAACLGTTWLVAAVCGGCVPVDSGVVEINWAFVDRDGDPIFPAGQLSVSGNDSCGLAGRVGKTTVDIDLEVELEICDPSCNGRCNGECRIIPAEQPGCDSARLTLTDVPASEDPYLFFLRAVVVTPQGDCVAPPPDCIAVPGPRQRTVLRGLITDLQVWQVVVDIDQQHDDALDLEACGCA